MDSSSLWPDWGKSGSKPNDGRSYDADDPSGSQEYRNPKDFTFNYLWSTLRQSFDIIDTEVNTLINKVETLEEEVSDLSEHGNEAHSTNFATDTHDNSAHDPDFAVQGTPQPPKEHGNDAHSDPFLRQSSYAPEVDTHDRYDDSEATSAVDAEVTDTAASVAGLDAATSDLEDTRLVLPNRRAETHLIKDVTLNPGEGSSEVYAFDTPFPSLPVCVGQTTNLKGDSQNDLAHVELSLIPSSDVMGVMVQNQSSSQETFDVHIIVIGPRSSSTTTFTTTHDGTTFNSQ